MLNITYLIIALAAWYYPKPKEAAKQIACHVAFWRGVSVAR